MNLRRPLPSRAGAAVAGIALALAVPASAAPRLAPPAPSHTRTAPAQAPNAPTGLVASGQNQQVYLTWSAATDPYRAVTGYYVLRSGARIGQTSGLAFTDTHLTNGVAYSYTVEALDALGNVSTASASASATPAAPVPLGVSGSWHLKFDDEFDASSVDLTNWQPNWFGASAAAIGGPDNQQDQNCTDPSQVTAAAGILALTAVQRTCRASNGVTYPYASGLINTHKSFSFTYGYMEARVYLPATASGGPANFPAFWADGAGPQPASGELDVMEVLKSCGPGLGFHFHSSLGVFGGCAPLVSPTGWHTFAANWQPGVVTFYYDGHQVGQVTQGVTSSPMYLLLNNSVDPTYGAANLAPAAMQIDYVRVWQ